MTLLSLLEQLYDMPQRMSYSQFVKVRQDIRNHPDYHTIKDEFEQTYTKETGWLFMGSDYSSLEDRINALLTKDKNKLKVYTDGFDGHMLRAISYFGLPVDLNDVQAVNDSMKQYKKERQASKPITFACTYGGSYLTLMNSCGFTEDKAKQIESNYHELYKESDEWAKAKLETCSRQGYIDVAFGLRIRTPLVGRTVIGSSKTPNMASAEARSVANAFSGQSYGLLTNRALNEFMERVWNSEYKHDILPVATIHQWWM